MVTITITLAVLVMAVIFSCVFVVAFSTWHMTKRKQIGTQPPPPQYQYMTPPPRPSNIEEAEVIEIN
jgi:hypothetical protein